MSYSVTFRQIQIWRLTTRSSAVSIRGKRPEKIAYGTPEMITFDQTGVWPSCLVCRLQQEISQCYVSSSSFSSRPLPLEQPHFCLALPRLGTAGDTLGGDIAAGDTAGTTPGYTTAGDTAGGDRGTTIAKNRTPVGKQPQPKRQITSFSRFPQTRH
jgi:hypothetical protein